MTDIIGWFVSNASILIAALAFVLSLVANVRIWKHEHLVLALECHKISLNLYEKFSPYLFHVAVTNRSNLPISITQIDIELFGSVYSFIPTSGPYYNAEFDLVGNDIFVERQSSGFPITIGPYSSLREVFRVHIKSTTPAELEKARATFVIYSSRSVKPVRQTLSFDTVQVEILDLEAKTVKYRTPIRSVNPQASQKKFTARAIIDKIKEKVAKHLSKHEDR